MSGRKDGQCRGCCSEAKVNYKKRYPERVRASALKWFYKEPGRHLLQRYGLTAEGYNQIERRQKGLCAICRRPASRNGRSGTRLHVDHNHKTKHVRGLLCYNCNSAVGLFQDSPKILKAAIRYLEGGKNARLA